MDRGTPQRRSSEPANVHPQGMTLRSGAVIPTGAQGGSTPQVQTNKEDQRPTAPRRSAAARIFATSLMVARTSTPYADFSQEEDEASISAVLAEEDSRLGVRPPPVLILSGSGGMHHRTAGGGDGGAYEAPRRAATRAASPGRSERRHGARAGTLKHEENQQGAPDERRDLGTRGPRPTGLPRHSKLDAGASINPPLLAPERKERRIREDSTDQEESFTDQETTRSTFDSRLTEDSRRRRSRRRQGGWRADQGAEANNVATQAMLGAIAELVQQTRTLHKDRARPPQELQFGGRIQEDPNHFLEELEEFFRKEEIPERRKTPIAKTCFRAEAKTWVEKAIPTTVTWALFRSRFLDHYDSVATQSNIARRLYGDDQTQEQDAFSFITERMALFDRVAPDTPESRRIQTVVERLTPELRGLVRARDYDSMHQLIEYAVRFEGDLAAARAAQRKASGKVTTSAAAEKKPAENNNNNGSKKGGGQQAAPPPKTPQQQQQQGAKPPPPAAGGAAQGYRRPEQNRNLQREDWRRDQRPPPPAANQDWRRREAARPPPTSEASTSGPPPATGNVARAEVVGDPRPQEK